MILRDTWEQGSANLVLFPGATNQDSPQWAHPLEKLLGTHRTRNVVTASAGNQQSSPDVGLSEGDQGPNLISFPSLAEGHADERSGKMIHGIDSDRISSYLESRGHEGKQLQQATRRTERLLEIREAGGSLAVTDFVSDGGWGLGKGGVSDPGLFLLTSSEEAVAGGSPSSSWVDVIEPGGKPIGILLEEMISRDLPSWEPLGKTAGSAEDIFALNAVFRNPWFESVRLMAVSPSTGEVIAASIHSVGNIFSSASESADISGFILAAREIDPEARLVVSHNHPGGDPTPSGDDLRFQSQLEDMADDLGVTIMDHVITNGTRGYSMKDKMEFRMDPDMDVPWASVERLDMPKIGSNHDLRNLGVALRAANESANWVVYLDKRRRIRAMNLLPDDPKTAAKVILRDTSTQGTPDIVLFPGTANQDTEQWAKPINALLGHEVSRDMDSFPIEPDELSAREAGDLSEGNGGYNLISVPQQR